MAEQAEQTEHRNVPILTGQGATGIIGWTMASPAVVLTFLAVSLDLPVFLAGALVAIRQAAGTMADVFMVGPVSRRPRKKHGIAVSNVVTGLCFLAAIAAAAYGSKTLTMVTFVVAIFIIGFVQEIQSLMITDFLSDNVQSHNRMRMYYWQLAIGGVGAIGLTMLAHELMQDNAPFARHSAVVSIAVACFVISGLSMLAVQEPQLQQIAVPANPHSHLGGLGDFVIGVRDMWAESWFRKYILVRLLAALVTLSVPFFALIAASAHHDSAQGLTALVVSSAAGLAVAAPIWRVLNGYSNRAVMVTSALLVSLTAGALAALHFLDVDHDIHVHATALFVATVAVTGLTGAQSLYFMEVAPKEQRARANAVSKTIARLVLIVLSAAMAAIAHTRDVVWAVVFVALISLMSAIVSFLLTKTREQSHEVSTPSSHDHASTVT